MKRHMIFMAAISAAGVLATSCERENASANTGNPVEFRALIDKNDNARASLVDKTEDMTSFFVAAGLEVGSAQVNDLDFMQAAVFRTGATWDYAPKKYFPANDTPVNFYAYAPIKDVNMTIDGDAELRIEGNNVYFEYTVPHNQSVSNTAVDLLVAYATGRSSVNNQVAFAFDHALSGVTFSAKNSNPAGSELVYIITKIEITYLCSQGRFTYPSGWGDQDVVKTFEAGLPVSGVSVMPVGNETSYVNLLSANDIMMVLPQDSHTDMKVIITYSLKDGGGSFVYRDEELYLSLPGTFISFDAGTLYNFQFQFSELTPITFEVIELNGWAPFGQTIIPAP